jgi:hypothetical protein
MDEAGAEAHTPRMARGRDEENVIYPCMALPSDLHRVHAPDEEPEAHVRAARPSLRSRLRRLRRRRRSANAVR